MFSQFSDVLALLKYYDWDVYDGIEVDFGRTGCYFDPARGENWWTYYCEPIKYGGQGEAQEVHGDVPFARRREIEFFTSCGEAYQLIRQYIRFKPNILDQVKAFEKEHFAGQFVIGVHYRGTDKMRQESERIHPYQMYRAVRYVIKKLALTDYRIFLATDEEPMVDFFEGLFPGRVCVQPNVHRSASRTALPPHLDHPEDPYLLGVEAIVDSLLLSKSNFLIRTSSNLSLWSTFFNPELPVLELGERIDEDPFLRLRSAPGA